MATKSKLDKLAEVAYARFQLLPAKKQKNTVKAVKKLKFRWSKATPKL
jgi:hypothetical protein